MVFEGIFGLERSKNFQFERDNCVFGNRIKPQNSEDLHLPRVIMSNTLLILSLLLFIALKTH